MKAFLELKSGKKWALTGKQVNRANKRVFSISIISTAIVFQCFSVFSIFIISTAIVFQCFPFSLFQLPLFFSVFFFGVFHYLNWKRHNNHNKLPWHDQRNLACNKCSWWEKCSVLLYSNFHFDWRVECRPFSLGNFNRWVEKATLDYVPGMIIQHFWFCF